MATHTTGIKRTGLRRWWTTTHPPSTPHTPSPSLFCTCSERPMDDTISEHSFEVMSEHSFEMKNEAPLIEDSFKIIRGSLIDVVKKVHKTKAWRHTRQKLGYVNIDLPKAYLKAICQRMYKETVKLADEFEREIEHLDKAGYLYSGDTDLCYHVQLVESFRRRQTSKDPNGPGADGWTREQVSLPISEIDGCGDRENVNFIVIVQHSRHLALQLGYQDRGRSRLD